MQLENLNSKMVLPMVLPLGIYMLVCKSYKLSCGKTTKQITLIDGNIRTKYSVPRKSVLKVVGTVVVSDIENFYATVKALFSGGATNLTIGNMQFGEMRLVDYDFLRNDSSLVVDCNFTFIEEGEDV